KLNYDRKCHSSIYSAIPTPRDLHLSLHDALPIFRHLGPESRPIRSSRENSGMTDDEQLGAGLGGAPEAPTGEVAPRRRSGLQERSEEHTSELQSLAYLVCRLLLEKKNHHDASGRT